MTARDDRRIPDLVSASEAAAMLNVTRQAILKMVDAGRLPGRKVGSTWVFRRVMVERYLNGQPADDRRELPWQEKEAGKP